MLTEKQNELLLFLEERITESGVTPSFEEMKDALGLKSKSRTAIRPVTIVCHEIMQASMTPNGIF